MKKLAFIGAKSPSRTALLSVAALAAAMVIAGPAAAEGLEKVNQGVENIARGRAEAAKDWLIGEGVPSGIIDLNFVSAGDYRSNNRLSDGRALNRRVDIEFISK
ncbi:hypothetical protein FPL03_23950 (plasmid) [Xanthomonas citri pv. glycines]|uniref:hypothetical protein n=1 Tax=Xanthomonas citri TaxID=346 RepID=UPI00118C32C3|nr:hypothetical protein [Xanthomonas citri]QDS14180.1 hypothetical protein FPL03_23950 [Xanthomonas citri pv. glycines]